MNPSNEQRQMSMLVVAVIAILLVVGLAFAGYLIEWSSKNAALKSGGGFVIQTCVVENGAWGCFEKLSANASQDNELVGRYIDQFRHFVSIEELIANCGLRRKAACGAKAIVSKAYRQDQVLDALWGTY